MQGLLITTDTFFLNPEPYTPPLFPPLPFLQSARSTKFRVHLRTHRVEAAEQGRGKRLPHFGRKDLELESGSGL